MQYVRRGKAKDSYAPANTTPYLQSISQRFAQLWGAGCGHDQEQQPLRMVARRLSLRAFGTRHIIEGVISKLKDQFSLERHRAKAL